MLFCDARRGTPFHHEAEDARWPLRTGARSDEVEMLTPALVRQTTSLWTFAKLALAWIIGILLAPLTLPFVLVWYVLAPFVLSTQKKNLTTLEARMRALHPLTGGVSEAYWGSLVASMTVPIVGIDQPENAPNTWRYLASLPLLLPVVLVPVAAATFSADLFTYIARSAAAAQFARFPRGAGTVASWRNTFMFPVLLIANAGARVVAYTYELTAFRAGAGMREGLNYWFHGNGLWTGSHDEVDAMLRSSQQRGPVRAGFFLIAPDIFASRILLFLSNIGRDSEWAAVRSQAHKMLFVPSSARLADLERRVRADWSPLAPPTAADLKDATCTVRLVTKCVFYALFGKWLDDADTEVLTGWRTMAATFVMPRATQRLLLNHGARDARATHATGTILPCCARAHTLPIPSAHSHPATAHPLLGCRRGAAGHPAHQFPRRGAQAQARGLLCRIQRGPRQVEAHAPRRSGRRDYVRRGICRCGRYFGGRRIDGLVPRGGAVGRRRRTRR